MTARGISLQGTRAAIEAWPMLGRNIMKRSPRTVSKIDVLGVQTALEVAAGGVFAAVLLRWVMM